MDNTPPNEKFLVNKSPDVQKVGVSKMKRLLCLFGDHLKPCKKCKKNMNRIRNFRNLMISDIASFSLKMMMLNNNKKRKEKLELMKKKMKLPKRPKS